MAENPIKAATREPYYEGSPRKQALPIKSRREKPEEYLTRLLSHCRKSYYPKGTLIIERGQKPDVLYYIISGSVTVLIEDPDGRRVVLAYLNQGDFFGEMGLFDEKEQRSAWVRTRCECEFAELSYERFRQIAKENTEVLFALLGQIAARLRKTSRKIVDLVFLDVAGRVARTLLDLCREPDAMTHPDGMQIKVTRLEIGSIVGCSREMAGRVLKELEEQGLISARGKTIIVHGWRKDVMG